jgi:hypothetical protein
VPWTVSDLEMVPAMAGLLLNLAKNEGHLFSMT